jgi:RNA polymerase sigma-70 factor (ECF subfamily)
MLRQLEVLSGDRSANAPARDERETPELADPLEDRIFALVYRQMRALVGVSAELDDLVQTAAEQALRALGTFERRAELATWTYRICYLTWLKQRRWYRRWYRRFTFSRDGNLPEYPDPHISAVDALQRQERFRRLRRALERVSPKRRTVVILHDLQAMSVEQIADIVSAHPNTVRSRLRDGRKRLAAELRRDPYFGDDACQFPEEP